MIPLNDPRVLTLARADVAPVFIHPHALVETSKVGMGSRVFAFAHISSGAIVGRDCVIRDHSSIEQGARIGDRVTVSSGVYLWSGTLLEDDVFVGPNVCFTVDKYPRAASDSVGAPRRVGREAPEPITVRRGASIGAGAILLPGIEIGEYALVGAGAIVSQSVPPHGLVVGQPARLVGQVCRRGHRLSLADDPSACLECQEADAQEQWVA